MPWIKNPSGRVVEVNGDNCCLDKARDSNEPEWEEVEAPKPEPKPLTVTKPKGRRPKGE